MLRPRFSLRWIFVAFALSGVFLYLWFVRPTSRGQSFVAAIQSGDFRAARALANDDSLLDGIDAKSSGVVDRVSAELTPWTWDDIWTARRRIWLHRRRREYLRGGYRDQTTITNVTSQITGFKVSKLPVQAWEDSQFEAPNYFPDQTLLP
jgi:hypothetical protein